MTCSSILTLLFLTSALAATAQPISVPFVGCAADGQVGPIPAPRGHAMHPQIPTNAALHLAFYKGPQDDGILAPRGWHCFETYGSGGWNLFVTPQQLDWQTLFHCDNRCLSGPAIQLSVVDGGTSGRFGVADTIRNYFPAYIEFARSVAKEGFDLGSPERIYPTDARTFQNDRTMLFTTPANTEGLGTSSLMLPSKLPITGLRMLFGPKTEPSLVELNIRLQSANSDLANVILMDVERNTR